VEASVDGSAVAGAGDPPVGADDSVPEVGDAVASADVAHTLAADPWVATTGAAATAVLNAGRSTPLDGAKRSPMAKASIRTLLAGTHLFI
jgi:hypothetical protein